MSTLANDINEYYEIDRQIKTLKERHDALNASIKTALKFIDQKEFVVGDVKAVFGITRRTSMNEERAIMKLKALNLNDAIKLVEKIDEPKLEELIYHGKLAPAELEDCVIVKEIETLSVKAVKAKKA